MSLGSRIKREKIFRNDVFLRFLLIHNFDALQLGLALHLIVFFSSIHIVICILLCLWNCIEEFQGSVVRIIPSKIFIKLIKVPSRKKNLIMIFGERGDKPAWGQVPIVSTFKIDKNVKYTVYIIWTKWSQKLH